MINLCRLCLPLLVALVAAGCSPIHNTLGPDREKSDLRESVEAPYQLSDGEAPFCNVPPMQIPETPKLVTAPEPFSAKLFFLLDKTEFTEESKVEAREVYQEILDREFSEIVISGHTDTSASNAYNEALSLRRSQKVLQDLILAEKRRRIHCVQNLIKLFIPNNLLSIIRKIRNKRINY